MLLLAALALSVSPAHAELFRCTAPDGHTTYQDIPCASGISSAVDPRGLSIIPATPARAQALPAATPPPPRVIYLPGGSQHQHSIQRRNAEVKARARVPLRFGRKRY
ncbi:MULTISPECIES: DUF4124 domain-containing protein [unclassified Halomonas]|uniref:DUF4124 domain-containing protein n=1 Tax=unclassified Halomonas TaxID=2609666 RepID=UPI00209CE4A9|nr:MULTISPECIES: DUF4124 domain-containing protein [unclassified Halomonas]MCP1314344.1 DUF4124 domain-containing protein [Halomonas sp. 707D7]MCP1326809.1 DUF4124 domain-containing protein [Halomonas sp. 707D4]